MSLKGPLLTLLFSKHEDKEHEENDVCASEQCQDTKITPAVRVGPTNSLFIKVTTSGVLTVITCISGIGVAKVTSTAHVKECFKVVTASLSWWCIDDNIVGLLAYNFNAFHNVHNKTFNEIMIWIYKK